MKYWYVVFLLCLVACTGSSEQKEASIRLWYDTPAQNWNEALPIGNGRLGAMVFGGTDKEQLQLNENTLYSGEPSVTFKDIKVTPEMKTKVVGLMKAGQYFYLPTKQMFDAFGEDYINKVVMFDLAPIASLDAQFGGKVYKMVRRELDRNKQKESEENMEK